jgi:hypothetical protein
MPPLAAVVSVRIKDDDMIYFSQRCHIITELMLQAHHITDASITTMVQSLSKLTKLRLISPQLLTDNAVRAIAEYLPKLKELWLEGNQNITNDSVINLIKRCSRLSYLSLASCEQISDPTLDNLKDSCRIQTFLCRDCPLITEAALTRLQQRLPELQILGNGI